MNKFENGTPVQHFISFSPWKFTKTNIFNKYIVHISIFQQKKSVNSRPVADWRRPCYIFSLQFPAVRYLCVSLACSFHLGAAYILHSLYLSVPLFIYRLATDGPELALKSAKNNAPIYTRSLFIIQYCVNRISLVVRTLGCSHVGTNVNIFIWPSIALKMIYYCVYYTSRTRCFQSALYANSFIPQFSFNPRLNWMLYENISTVEKPNHFEL